MPNIKPRTTRCVRLATGEIARQQFICGRWWTLFTNRDLGPEKGSACRVPKSPAMKS